MLERIVYGLLAISLVFIFIASDALIATHVADQVPFLRELLERGSIIPLACAFISIVACQELAVLLHRAGVRPHQRLATVICVALILAPWLSAAGFFGVGPAAREAAHLQLVLTAVAFLVSGAAQLISVAPIPGIADLSATWLMITYAGVLPSFLVMLRSDIHVPAENGAWIILVILAVCKASDIGAYFLGTWFGRHKLVPRVSPGKSVEGFLGGILASCAVSLLFMLLYSLTLPNENVLDEGTMMQVGQGYKALAHRMVSLFQNLSVVQVVIFGVVTSIVGQVGDLLESVIKRSAGVKDSASILPGFGGILDMIDSPLAVAPVAWLLLTQVWSAL